MGKIAFWYFLLNVSTLEEDGLNPFSFSSYSIFCLVPAIHFHAFFSLVSPQRLSYLVESSPIFEWNFFAKGLQNVKTEVHTSELQL